MQLVAAQVAVHLATIQCKTSVASEPMSRHVGSAFDGIPGIGPACLFVGGQRADPANA